MFNYLNAVLTTGAPQEAPKLFLEPGNFVEMLRYMGIGMLVIFVLICVIILVTTAINIFFSRKQG
ncbi:MAG: hypothetical protein E7459_00205 [Ruminococcaceae bacterium]|nr:hypothetical protein [Oscillospiraceae bacterium]